MTDHLVKRLRAHAHWGMTEEAADRIEALTAERDAAKAKVEQLGCELNVAKYGQPNFAWSVHVTAMVELQAERERLALAICGGEDAPGYANAQTIEILEHVAKQNQQSHGATINSLLAAEADNARLREALRDIAKQKKTTELETEYDVEWADFEGGYDAIIDVARAALKGETP